MDKTRLKRGLSVILSFALIAVTTPIDAGAMMFYQGQEAAPASPSNDYPGQGAPLTAAELQGLVAPIALYPDALVAQILSASTYPDQVAIADNWLQQNKNLTGNPLMQAVNGQTWDPSVKALTQFPSIAWLLEKQVQHQQSQRAFFEFTHDDHQTLCYLRLYANAMLTI